MAATVHASGFIACYLAALVLGQPAPAAPARRSTGFATALGWLAQIGLFVLLGLLASPTQLRRPARPGAVVIGLVLLLVARPLSVLVSLPPFRMPWRDQAFLSWAGLRGAVPVVLATVPADAGHARTSSGSSTSSSCSSSIFTIVQAPTLPWVARRLGLAERCSSRRPDLETTPLEELGADVIQVTVGPASRLHGVEVFELRLPEGANVTLVVRDGEGFVPQRDRRVLRHGDQLLVVTTADGPPRTERRIRDVAGAAASPAGPSRLGAGKRSGPGRSPVDFRRLDRGRPRPEETTSCRRTPTRAPRAATPSTRSSRSATPL